MSEADVNGTARRGPLPRTNDATYPTKAEPATVLEGPPLRERYRTRADAAVYLSDRLGRRITIGALHRHASDGSGPRYVLLLGRASYRTEWLDAWIESLVRQPAARRRSVSTEPGNKSRRTTPKPPASASPAADPTPAAPAAEPGPSTTAHTARRGKSIHAA